MSDDGWQAFLAADGLEDWAVLHGGATAVFVTDSLGEAARLADAVAGVAGLAGSGALLTMTDRTFSVRLTRDVRALTADHIDLARGISAVARRFGISADTSKVQEVQLVVAAKADAANLPFWRAVLGYDASGDRDGVDPIAHGSTMWLQELDAKKALRHAMHVDVSVPLEHARARVDAAVAAGGIIVAHDEAPELWILADAAGNKVCICAWPDGAKAEG